MKLTKSQREAIRKKADGHCWYCGCELPAKGWHVDHVEPVIRNVRYVNGPNGYRGVSDAKNSHRPQNHNMDNMVPSCAPCNLFKSTHSLEGFREEIEAQIERVRKAGSGFRIAERFGLIKTHPQKVTFYFEKKKLG